MKTVRPILIGVALALSAAGANAQLESNRPITLVIKSQVLRDALNDWAQQTGFQLISPSSEIMNRLVVPTITGSFSPRAALEQLLAGTSLTYELLDERTVVIRERSKSAVSTTSWQLIANESTQQHIAYAGDVPRGDTRIAQAETGRTNSDGPRALNVVEGASFSPDAVHELIVTGTRLRSAQEGPSEVIVFDREQIDAMAVSTIPDLLKFLPQQIYNRGENYNFGGAQFVELRGLGLDTTLVLINGRRTIPSAPNVAFNAFDLNSIPLAAVKRVEVLSDSASAVYGADAIGGVINVILKNEIPEPTLDFHYGAASGGAEERRSSLSAGYGTESLRSAVMLDYFDRDFLLGEERPYSNDQDFRRFGSTDRRSPNANPGNVTSTTTANLPGLTSRFAAVPDGSTGVGLTPASFLATAGQRNMESSGRYTSPVPAAVRKSAAATLEYDFTPDLTGFAEALYTDRQTETQGQPSTLNSTVVPTTNPFNPFGVPVAVNFSLSGIGPTRGLIEAELLRAVGGVRGNLRDWQWEVSVLRTEEDGSSWTANAADPARVAAALASTDAATALNPFMDGPGASAEVLRSLIATPVLSDYESDGMQASAFVRGTLFNLPGGAVDVVAGGESREESIHFNSGTFVDADRTVSAGFAEARVPIVGRDMSVPAAREISITLAGRYDDYSDFGGTFNPQFGLVWKPAMDLLIRGSYGESFRAPSLFDLYAPRTQRLPLSVPDPRRNEIASAVPISGGDPTLDPTEATSVTAGFVYTPRQVSGLRLSATYWNIDIDERVSVLTVAQLLANESLFPERIIRGTPTPADVAAGRPGPLLIIDGSRINSGRLKTDGADFSVAYRSETRWGRFAPNLSLTWVNSFRTVDVVGAPETQRVGIANQLGTIPRWRGTVGLEWAFSGLSVSTAARYIPEYDDATTLGVPNGRTISGQTLVDLQLGVDWSELLGSKSPIWKGLTLRSGVTNVFDERPPFAEIGLSLGFDTSQGDIRQRFGYVRLSKAF